MKILTKCAALVSPLCLLRWTLNLCVAFFMALLASFPLFAQLPKQITGTPKFGSFSGGPDVIDNANLNFQITIPVFHRAGRNLNFDFNLVYQSSIWSTSNSTGTLTWVPVTTWGWGTGGTDIGRISFTKTVTTMSCIIKGQTFTAQKTVWSNWVYADGSGTTHSFSGSAVGIGAQCAAGGSDNATGFSSTAGDGSGYQLVVTGDCCAIRLDATIVTSPTGNQIVPLGGVKLGQVPGSIQDTNGNLISSDSSGHLTDTLGTVAMTTAGAAPNPLTYTYTAPSGAAAAFTAKYATFSVQTNFACSGIAEYGANGTTTASLVSEVDLPDNSKYTFTYEATPGHSGFVTGRLASVTLPTGGSISYSYSGGSNGIECSDGTTAGFTRTTPDGVWTYSRVLGTSPASSTTITDPQGNQTFMQFVGTYPTVEQVYQGTIAGANLLRSTTTCYDGLTSNCATTFFGTPISQRAVTIQLGTNGPQCKHVYFYDGGAGTLNTGVINEQDDYDYGASAVGPLIKKTLYTYNTNLPPSLTNVKIENAAGAILSQTTYAYDETAVVTPPNQPTPQHTSVGSKPRRNLTTLNNGLTQHWTYYDTGLVATHTDFNGAVTTSNFGTLAATCGNSFPTSLSEPLSLSKSMTWNCNGGIQLTGVDENGNTAQSSFTDAFLWRPASTTDAANVVTNYSYLSPTALEATLSINANSAIDTLTTLDGLGRSHLRQTRQAPGSANFDTAEQDYDSLGRPNRSTIPYNGNSGQTNSTAPAVTTTYDALGRPSTITDAGGGTVTYSYSQNDVLITVGPAPIGENAKRRQLEYDSLGRLTSVCELTAAAGSGTCGQTNSQTGFWTKYSYDVNNNLLSVTQNAQAPASSQQTRSYAYDSLSRMISETNPENGTTTYAYDSATGCAGTYSGDLVKKADAVGNITCFTYDTLHRILSMIYPSGAYASATPSKFFVYDSATVNGVTLSNTKGRLAEAYTCTTCPSAKLTDLGYSYTARGEVSDVYESAPHSSGYYHLTQSYWPHGTPNQLSGLVGVPTITYGGTIGSTAGLDGEGRVTQITASSGQNPVIGTIFNTYAIPPTNTVTYGSTDSDVFNFDAATNRLTQYKFNIGTAQSMTGALTWNANSTLRQLAITDPFNSADTQACTYGYDDLTRLTGANCGTAWSGTYTFDPFGNIAKSGSMNFSASYSNSTNRMTLVGTFTPTYDANGNVLNDGAHTYTWDSDGNSITADGVGVTFDALDRAVEQNRSGSFTELVYGPGGDKLALMNGQTLVRAFVPLTGGATAVYTSAGLDHYRHTDWLGSNRLSSTPSRTVQWSGAYGPWGELYASSGSADPSFTGQNSDTSSTGEYDFLYRQYGTQGRWPNPDPAGIAAVDPKNPQSWNRYAYVLNNPLRFVDPQGRTCFALDEDGNVTDHTIAEIDNAGDCSDAGDFGGEWITVDTTVTVNADDTGDLSSWTYWDSGGDWGHLPSGNFSWAPPRESFWNCVKGDADYFSLQHGLQAVSGGRLGNSWLSGAFLGSSTSSVITVGQYAASKFSGATNGPTGGEALSTGAAEVVGDTAGPVAEAAAHRLPNVAVTVAATASVAVRTPTVAAQASLSGAVSGTIPLGGIAGVGAKALNVLGEVKLPFDLAVTGFSVVVCGIGR